MLANLLGTTPSRLVELEKRNQAKKNLQLLVDARAGIGSLSKKLVLATPSNAYNQLWKAYNEIWSTVGHEHAIIKERWLRNIFPGMKLEMRSLPSGEEGAQRIRSTVQAFLDTAIEALRDDLQQIPAAAVPAFPLPPAPEVPEPSGYRPEALRFSYGEAEAADAREFLDGGSDEGGEIIDHAEFVLGVRSARRVDAAPSDAEIKEFITSHGPRSSQEMCLRDLAREIHAMRNHEAMHALWASAASGRTPKKRSAAVRDVETRRSEVKRWLRATEEFEKSVPEGVDMSVEFLACVAAGRRVLFEKISQLTSAIRLLDVFLADSMRQSKKKFRNYEGAKQGFSVELFVSPLTVDIPWDMAVSSLSDDIVSAPFSGEQMRAISQILRSVAAVSLDQLLRTHPPAVKEKELAKKCMHQLVDTFPCMAVAMRHASGRYDIQSQKVISVELIRGMEGSAYFWSLLYTHATNYKKRPENHTFQFLFDNLDTEDAVGSADSRADAVGNTESRAGRNSLEAKYGAELLSFIRNFILTRGQNRIDHHRLSSTGRVYGAPLRAIAAAATEAGFPCTYNGIYNLMMAPRKNATNSSCRGVIDARPARTVATTQLWHSRRFFSSKMFKYLKELMVLIQGDGFDTLQADGDDMATVSAGRAAARSKSSPKGFLLKQEDGSPSMTQLDHDFAIGSNMVMQTTGWSIGKPGSDEAIIHEDDRAMIRTARPGYLQLTIRFKRFCPTNYVTHMDDLEEALDTYLADKAVKPKAMVLGVDNGGQFDVDNPLMQHLALRIWKKYQLMFLAFGGHSPLASSFHFEIEGQFPWVRRAIAGHHFGFSAASVEIPDEKEDQMLERVAAVAVEEYMSVLEDAKARSQKKVDIVHRGPTDSRTTDAHTIREYYSEKNAEGLKQEKYKDVNPQAALFCHHINLKIPSCLILTQCTGSREHMCEYCLSQHPDSSGNPVQEVLKPLRNNNYRMWVPQIPDTASGASSNHDVVEECLECVADYKDKETDQAVRHRYPDLLTLIGGPPQRLLKIPVNKSAAWERVYPCKFQKFGCCYFSKSKAEYDRHVLCHHEAAMHDDASPAGGTAAAAVVPTISYAGCAPIVKVAKSKASAAETMNADDGACDDAAEELLAAPASSAMAVAAAEAMNADDGACDDAAEELLAAPASSAMAVAAPATPASSAIGVAAPPEQLTIDVNANALHWVYPKSGAAKMHFAHAPTGAPSCHPMHPFAPGATVGKGLAAALAERKEICDRCFFKLSAELQGQVLSAHEALVCDTKG